MKIHKEQRKPSKTISGQTSIPARRAYTARRMYNLSNLARHPAPNKRVKAVIELTKFGTRTSRIYIKFLSDPHLDVRIEAVKAIKKYGNAKAAPELERIIETESGAIVRLAKQALIQAKRKSPLSR